MSHTDLTPNYYVCTSLTIHIVSCPVIHAPSRTWTARHKSTTHARSLHVNNRFLVLLQKMDNIYFCQTQQAVKYLSRPPEEVFCASGTQTLSIARFTVITALSLIPHHVTPTFVETPVDTSGWTSQEQHTMNYQDAQVRYEAFIGHN